MTASFIIVTVALVAVLGAWMVDRWRTDRDRRVERVELLAALLARTPHELTTAVRQLEPQLAPDPPKRRSKRGEGDLTEQQIPVGL